MNEQIKNLWNKAAESTAAYPSGQNNSWETQVNFIEKFAELIIRECAEVADMNAVEAMGLYGKVLEHFGVEV
jgi:hypothetical protein